MSRFHHADQKLWQALRTLAGPESQRQRLEAAYVEHLSELQDADLPAAQQGHFALVRDTLTHERRLRPEIVVAGMSDAEVSAAVGHILDLCDAVMEIGAEPAAVALTAVDTARDAAAGEAAESPH
jgi:hypothetical protein